MFHVYKGQFLKLLAYVGTEFLPDLEKATDPDTKWVPSTSLAPSRKAQLPGLPLVSSHVCYAVVSSNNGTRHTPMWRLSLLRRIAPSLHSASCVVSHMRASFVSSWLGASMLLWPPQPLPGFSPHALGSHASSPLPHDGYKRLIALVASDLLAFRLPFPARHLINGAALRAVHSRLQLFMNERTYTKAPEGRQMPVTDESAQLDNLLPEEQERYNSSSNYRGGRW